MVQTLAGARAQPVIQQAMDFTSEFGLAIGSALILEGHPIYVALGMALCAFCLTLHRKLKADRLHRTLDDV